VRGHLRSRPDERKPAQHEAMTDLRVNRNVADDRAIGLDRLKPREECFGFRRDRLWQGQSCLRENVRHEFQRGRLRQHLHLVDLIEQQSRFDQRHSLLVLPVARAEHLAGHGLEACRVGELHEAVRVVRIGRQSQALGQEIELRRRHRRAGHVEDRKADRSQPEELCALTGVGDRHASLSIRPENRGGHFRPTHRRREAGRALQHISRVRIHPANLQHAVGLEERGRQFRGLGGGTVVPHGDGETAMVRLTTAIGPAIDRGCAHGKPPTGRWAAKKTRSRGLQEFSAQTE